MIYPLRGQRREENFEGIHKNGASYSLLSEGNKKIRRHTPESAFIFPLTQWGVKRKSKNFQSPILAFPPIFFPLPYEGTWTLKIEWTCSWDMYSCQDICRRQKERDNVGVDMDFPRIGTRAGNAATATAQLFADYHIEGRQNLRKLNTKQNSKRRW